MDNNGALVFRMFLSIVNMKRSFVMKTKNIATASAAVLILSSLAIHAEPLDVKTGLWETTFTTDMSGMKMPSEVINSMPPERRARMEAAMKARQASGPKSTTDKTCLTKEDLNRPFDQTDGDPDCKNTIVSATSTHAEYKIVCTGSESRNGSMQIDALSRESIKATMKMNTSNGPVSNQITSKWVAADCGDVQ